MVGSWELCGIRSVVQQGGTEKLDTGHEVVRVWSSSNIAGLGLSELGMLASVVWCGELTHFQSYVNTREDTISAIILPRSAQSCFSIPRRLKNFKHLSIWPTTCSSTRPYDKTIQPFRRLGWTKYKRSRSRRLWDERTRRDN